MLMEGIQKELVWMDAISLEKLSKTGMLLHSHRKIWKFLEQVRLGAGGS